MFRLKLISSEKNSVFKGLKQYVTCRKSSKTLATTLQDSYKFKSHVRFLHDYLTFLHDFDKNHVVWLVNFHRYQFSAKQVKMWALQ